MKYDELSFGGIVRWIAQAFFWGIGILFIYTFLEAIMEFVRSLGGGWWRGLLSTTIIGAIVMSIYNKSFKLK